MRKTYDNLQYPCHLSERWSDVLPLIAEPGKVTLGDLTLTRATWVERSYGRGDGKSWGRFLGLYFPEELHKMLPKGTQFNYRDPDNRKRLVAVFGPSFPRRWNLANYLAFNLPIIRQVGTLVFNADIRGTRGVGTDPARLDWYWEHLPLYQQLISDGYVRFLPMIRQLSCGAISARLSDAAYEQAADFQCRLHTHPIVTLRDLYGKGLWKRLCAQAPTRLIQMSSLVAPFVRSPNYYAELRAMMAELVELPTSLLRNPWLAGRNVHQEEDMEQELLAVRRLRELGKQRPWPYTVRLESGRTFNPEYSRAMDDWQLVAYHLPNADPRWSHRRVHEEHERLVHQQRQEQLRRRQERQALLYAPVTVPSGASYSYSNLATRLTARLLATPDEYIQQGHDQQHCVGGYGDEALAGRVVTYSIERDGAIISTAMFDRSGHLLQHYGKYNDHVTDPDALNLVSELKFRTQSSWLSAKLGPVCQL